MPKVCITLVSNKPDMLKERWFPSLPNIAPFCRRYGVRFAFQFNDPVGADIQEMAFEIGEFRNRLPYPTTPFNWVEYKNDACDMFRDADYWLCVDDDFRFQPTTKSGYDINERYSTAIEYMEANPSCGVVMMKGFLDGSKAKFGLAPVKNDIYEIAHGLILRNVSKDWSYAKPVFNVAGALDETAAIFSRVEDGYYIAKGFNTPVAKIATKQIDENTPSLAYKPSYINTLGLGRVIRERYEDPTYDHNKRYLPKKLLEMYRQSGGTTYG